MCRGGTAPEFGEGELCPQMQELQRTQWVSLLCRQVRGTAADGQMLLPPCRGARLCGWSLPAAAPRTGHLPGDATGPAAPVRPTPRARGRCLCRAPLAPAPSAPAAAPGAGPGCGQDRGERSPIQQGWAARSCPKESPQAKGTAAASPPTAAVVGALPGRCWTCQGLRPGS